MKFLLSVLTIVGLTNIANSSDLQSTKKQNNNSHNIISQIVDQSNTSQNQYLQKKKYRDCIQDKKDSKSQENDDDLLSSLDEDDDNSEEDENNSFVENTISQDIINNKKILSKYPILKLIKNDDIDVQNMTIKELCKNIKQCCDDIEEVYSNILNQYKNNEGNISEDDKGLVETLLWTFSQLTLPFCNWYEYLMDNNNLRNVIESISNQHFNIKYLVESENEIESDIGSIMVYLGFLNDDLNRIPKKYLNKTVEEVLSQAEQNYKNYIKINNKEEK